MRHQKHMGLVQRLLPERAEIQIEALADVAQGIVDLLVELVCGHIDEPHRKIKQQRLEVSLFPAFVVLMLVLNHGCVPEAIAMVCSRRACTVSQMSAATSSSEAWPSTTAKRPGSAAAISR